MTALPSITKTDMAPAFRTGRVECGGFVAEDGEWSGEREDFPGTRWLLRHRPSVADGSCPLPVTTCGTLKACLRDVASGFAAAELERRKAEEATR